MRLKPFVCSDDYLEWAHGSLAEEGWPSALRILAAPLKGKARVIDAPELVAEIADVAELYVGGRDTVLRAARVRARAVKWLAARGLTVKGVLHGKSATMELPVHKNQ